MDSFTHLACMQNLTFSPAVSLYIYADWPSPLYKNLAQNLSGAQR